MSTQTTDSDSPSAAGFQLGYLHKQAEDNSQATWNINDYTSDDPQVQQSIADGATFVDDVPPNKPSSSSPSSTMSISGSAPDPFPEMESDNEEPSWYNTLILGQPAEEIDPAEGLFGTGETPRLSMAKYRPVKTEAPAGMEARNNREAIRKILTSLAPGAAIGGTAGVGLSLAGDARKGGGVNLGKAVGMGVGGATLGALIQGLAQRNKMKAMMA